MLPETVVLADPILVKLPAPLITPDKVKLPVEEPIDVSLPKTIGPLKEPDVLLELVNAPPLPTPVPFKVRVLVLVMELALISNAPPISTKMAPPLELPNAAALPAFKVPAEMVVPPV